VFIGRAADERLFHFRDGMRAAHEDFDGRFIQGGFCFDLAGLGEHEKEDEVRAKGCKGARTALIWATRAERWQWLVVRTGEKRLNTARRQEVQESKAQKFKKEKAEPDYSPAGLAPGRRPLRSLIWPLWLDSCSAT